MPGIFNSLNSIEDIIKFIGTFSPDTDPQARENTNMEYKEAQKIFYTNEIGKDYRPLRIVKEDYFFMELNVTPVILRNHKRLQD